MREQERLSQLSALFDGALPQQQAEMVIRRALKDPALRTSWERYALIGACLRGDPLPSRAPAVSLADRVRAQLAAEPEPVSTPGFSARSASSAVSRGRLLLGRGALGGAIAAGVAILSLVVVREVAPVGEPATLLAQVPAAPAAEEPVLIVAAAPGAPPPRAQRVDSMPPSYTTPGQNSPASRGLEPQLAHYLVAHSEMAASSFGFTQDLTRDAVELTQAEIEAHR